MRNSFKKAKVGDLIYTFNLFEGYKLNIITGVNNVISYGKVLYFSNEDSSDTLVVKPAQYKNDYICNQYVIVSLDLKKFINLLDRIKRDQDILIQQNIEQINRDMLRAKKDLENTTFFNRKIGDCLYIFDKCTGYKTCPIAFIQKTPTNFFFYFKDYPDVVIPYEKLNTSIVIDDGRIFSTVIDDMTSSMLEMVNKNNEKIQKLIKENNFITKEIHANKELY